MSGRLSILELRSVRGTGGGPEKTILLGAERRDRDRFDVTVCYLRDTRDDVFAVDERARQLGVDYVEVRERGSFDPRLWRSLRRILRERRIDLIHAHDYKTNLLAWSLARWTGVRALSTAHGWTGQSARERRLYYPLDKRLLATFSCVVAVSSEIREELLRWGARPDRVTVLLNGIEPEVFRRRPERRDLVRARFGWRPTDYVIGSVGRLERQKRFDLLLEAFAAARTQQADLRLVIVGGGSLAAALERQAAALGLSGSVTLLGHRDDVAELHHGLDLFVQPSEYEGTPNAVLEAMALETPIVATDVGGTAEIARPGTDALIVPRNDPAALARAILELRHDPDGARTRAAAARRRVETELSFETRTRRLEQLYESLMAGGPAGAFPLSSSFYDA